MAKQESNLWFVVADAGIGRFCECSRTKTGRLHVDELSIIEYQTEEHEHGRPSPRAGKNGNAYASVGHEDSHQLHRFAKEFTGWLEGNMRKLDVAKLPIFAPPRFLGELRKVYGAQLVKRIEELQADLTGLSTAALAKHPSVEELVSSRMD